MKYTTENLMYNAPVGVGGICPICNGILDGRTWAMCDKSHEERCTKCASLITLNKKGKIKIQDYIEQRENYNRFLSKKEQLIKNTNIKIEKIKNRKKGILEILGLNDRSYHYNGLVHDLKMRVDNYTFSVFKTY